MKAEDGERTCIVTREALPRDRLIRFVAGPGGALVPDLKATLPGRGCWVTGERGKVVQAMKRKAFARALKTEIDVPPDLDDIVDRLLARNALGAIGLLRKAGALATGAAKTEDLIRSGRAAFTLHASDAAADGVRKMLQAWRAAAALGGPEPAAYAAFTSAELSAALGGGNVIHAAASGPAAGGARAKVDALVLYRGAGALSAGPA